MDLLPLTTAFAAGMVAGYLLGEGVRAVLRHVGKRGGR
jgi:hypothetical protein